MTDYQLILSKMKSLREVIKEKRCGLLSCGVMMLHNNLLVHNSKKVQAAVLECGFQQVSRDKHSSIRPKLGTK